jgi:hypothetical protein
LSQKIGAFLQDLAQVDAGQMYERAED